MQLEVQREAFDTISNDEITILDNAGLPSVMVPIKKFPTARTIRWIILYLFTRPRRNQTN